VALLVLGGAVIGLTGCASLRSKEQGVLVKTEPAGIQVYQDQNFLGVTPVVIPLEHERRTYLVFRSGQVEETRRLEADYRWNDSFFANLIFFTFAPAGWTVDLITESAWKFPEQIDYQLSLPEPAKGELPKRLPRLAIAPPLSANPEISHRLGQILTEMAQERFGDNYDVLVYEETRSAFPQEAITRDDETVPDDTQRLHGVTGSRFILFSKVESVTDRGIKMAAYLHDGVELKNMGQALEFFVPVDKLPEIQKGAVVADKKSLFRFLPNTLALDFASATAQLNFAGRERESTRIERDDLWSEVSQMISVFSIRNLELPYEGREWRLSTRWVPSANLSLSTEAFPTVPELTGLEFRVSHVDVGFGPYLSYSSGKKSVFFNIALGGAYDDILVRGPSVEKSVDKFSVNVFVETGFQYFFYNRWNFRLFFRSVTVPQELWQEAIYKATNTIYPIEAANIATGGFTVGYTFPPKIWGWLF